MEEGKESFYIDKAISLMKKILKKDLDICTDIITNYLYKIKVRDLNELTEAKKVYLSKKSTEPDYLDKKKDEKVELDYEKAYRDFNEINSFIKSIFFVKDYIYPQDESTTPPISVSEDIKAFILDNKDLFADFPFHTILENCSDLVINLFNEKIFNKVYYFLIKSFLDAEYLLESCGYLEEIEKFYDYFKQKASEDEEDEVRNNIAYFCVEKSFLKSILRIINVIKLIYAKLDRNNFVVTENRFEEEIEELFVDKFVSGRNIPLYGLFMDSVMDMTIIDHEYRLDVECIKKLLILKRRGENLLNKKDLISEKDSIYNVIKNVIIKSNTLLYRILVEQKNDKYNLYKQGNIKYNYCIDEKEQNQIKENSLYKDENPISDDIAIKYIKKNKIEINSKEDSYSQTYDDFIYRNIKQYNILIEKYKSLEKFDCEDLASENIQILDNFIEFCEGYEGKILNLNFSLLSELIIKVHNTISNLLDSIENDVNNSYENKTYELNLKHAEKLIFKLKVILIKLRRYWKACDNYNVPPISVHLLKQSFYPNYENRKFFIASSTCYEPYNSDYVKRFYDEYHSERKFLSDKYYTVHNLKILESIKVSAKKQLEVINKRTEEEKKEFNNVKEKIKKQSKIVKEESKKQLQNTITILGVLAAFLAFTTVNVGVLKIANDMKEFILFLTTSSFMICLFVLLIKLDILNRIQIITISAIILALLIISSYLYCSCYF